MAKNTGTWEDGQTKQEMGAKTSGSQDPRDMPSQQSEDSTKCKNFACDIFTGYYTLTPTHTGLFWRLGPKACLLTMRMRHSVSGKINHQLFIKTAFM